MKITSIIAIVCAVTLFILVQIFPVLQLAWNIGADLGLILMTIQYIRLSRQVQKCCECCTCEECTAEE